MQQISGYQTARTKLPLWAATEGILYPPHLNMEQCSSQYTAEYKAGIISHPSGEMTDLTAGFGVDATMMGRHFDRLNYVERNPQLCDIARNNLPLLRVRNNIICGEAQDVLPELPHQSLIYLDPARRDDHGGKVVAISQCTPDVTQMLPELLAKADRVMVKLSPMLDVRTVQREMHHISQIHIVSLDGECKEMLVLMQPDAEGEPTVHCANIHSADGSTDSIVFPIDAEQHATCSYAQTLGSYLYEPNASIMKGGCFRTLAERMNLQLLSPDSHLYTSDVLVDGFPGRTFRIEASSSLNKKEAKQLLQGITQANITVRNFPQTVADLRKRLKLSDGGSTYLFATTLMDGSKVLIRCTRH